MIRLSRHSENPILSPTTNPWENILVFNPAVTVDNGVVHMLYRAQGKDSISRLGYAKSTDGINFERRSNWVYEGGGHQQETLGIEDPRLVKIDDLFYVVYTAVSELEGVIPNPSWKEHVVKRIRVSAATTQDFEHFNDIDVIIPEVEAKNACLFPKKFNGYYWLLFRNPQADTYFCRTNHLGVYSDPKFVFNEREGFWDEVRTGVGAPPLETDLGWLIFYHGVDKNNTYRLGIILLAKDNPSKVLYRSKKPILEPIETYEKVGFIPNVVFTCGAIDFQEKYFIYYGASDQTICLATIAKEELIHEIEQNL